MSGRAIEVTLVKRAVSARAHLLEDDAPATSAAVWSSLPLGGMAWHAKYAGNEIYTMVPPLSSPPPPLENPTVTPQRGDLCYFWFPEGTVARSFIDENSLSEYRGVVDLAIFYGRNNLLLSPSLGSVPCSVFATMGPDSVEFFRACDDMWRRGFEGERLEFTRAE